MKSLSILFLLTCGTFASPLAVEKHVQSRDVTITPSEIDNLKLFANLTAASYCPNNQDPLSVPGQAITCNGTICASVEANDVTSLLQFGANDSTTTASLKGFLAVSAPQKSIILAFAGSGQTIRTWLTNFNFGQTSYAAEDASCESCTVHSGFLTAWHERRDVILSALTAATAQYADYEVVITGHSIGGAVATLAALEMLSLPLTTSNLSLYTYGSPRIGNVEFATFATSSLSQQNGVKSYRVTHKNDPVPQIPPTWIAYEHLAPEYWIPDEDESGSSLVVCEGIGNSSCNAGTGLIPLQGESHSWYFGTIDACVGGLEW